MKRKFNNQDTSQEEQALEEALQLYELDQTRPHSTHMSPQKKRARTSISPSPSPEASATASSSGSSSVGELDLGKTTAAALMALYDGRGAKDVAAIFAPVNRILAMMQKGADGIQFHGQDVIWHLQNYVGYVPLTDETRKISMRYGAQTREVIFDKQANEFIVKRYDNDAYYRDAQRSAKKYHVGDDSRFNFSGGFVAPRSPRHLVPDANRTESRYFFFNTYKAFDEPIEIRNEEDDHVSDEYSEDEYS